MGSLAERSIELHLRDEVRFGVGALDELPGMTAAADQAGPGGSARAFIVTDEGVRRSGVVDRVRAVLEAAGVEVGLFAGVEPNPGTTSIELGSAALDGFGLGDTVVVPVGGGSAMDSAKVISLHAMNGGDILDLGYHRADLRPGRPLVAVPTTAGTGAETNSYGVVTDEVAGRKVVHRPPVRSSRRRPSSIRR